MLNQKSDYEIIQSYTNFIKTKTRVALKQKAT